MHSSHVDALKPSTPVSRLACTKKKSGLRLTLR